MASGIWETLKKIEESNTKTFGCPKCILEKVRTHLKQNIQNFFEHSSYVRPVRKILKHSAVADLFRTLCIKTLYFSSYFFEVRLREF